MRTTTAVLLLLLSWSAASTQSFYSVSFRDGSAHLPLYQGFSNDVKFEVVRPDEPCKPLPYEIRIEGGQVEYTSQSPFVKILPKAPLVKIQVYTPVDGKWLTAGKVEFATLKPDLKETSFKLAMGSKKPQGELASPRSFTGGSDEPAPAVEIWLIEPAIPMLTGGKNQLKVYVADESRTDGCTPQKDIELVSDEATVTKISRNHFEIVPGEGRQRCAVEVRMDGIRISTEILQVRPK
jgi:hypothetical protein